MSASNPFANVGGIFAEEREIELWWERLNIRRTIPTAVMLNSRLEWRDTAFFELEGAMMELTAHVLGQRLPKNTVTETGWVNFSYPASWWDHFKQAHAERWWMRRHVARRPVLLTHKSRSVTLTATWEHMAMYPWSDYVTPAPEHRFGRPVRIRWVDYSTRVTPESETEARE